MDDDNATTHSTPQQEPAESFLGLLDEVRRWCAVASEDPQRRSPLYLASRAGDLQGVVALLTAYAEDDLREESEGVRKFLRVSVEERLRRREPDEKEHEDGFAPLHVAAHRGHALVVRLCVARGADMEATDNRDWTPLRCAVEKGHFDIVQYLVAQRANLNANVNMHRCSPLHSATKNGHIDIVARLLVDGADAEAKNVRGETPFCYAVHFGREEVVKELVANFGAMLNVTQRCKPRLLPP